jgi:hypothetical protein
VEATAQSIQQVFTGIVTQIKSLDEVIAEIAAASKEQKPGRQSEVNMAVNQMDKVTQSNAAAAEENAASAQEMNAQARNLQTVIGQLEQIVVGGPTALKPERPTRSRTSPRITGGSKTKAQPAPHDCRSGAHCQSWGEISTVADDRDIPMPELAGT